MQNIVTSSPSTIDLTIGLFIFSSHIRCPAADRTIWTESQLVRTWHNDLCWLAQAKQCDAATAIGIPYFIANISCVAGTFRLTQLTAVTQLITGFVVNIQINELRVTIRARTDSDILYC